MQQGYRVKKILTLILAGLALGSPLSVEAGEFFYKFNAGDKYRIISTVNQDIYIDRTLSYRSEIINRISVEVAEASAEKGQLVATFQSAEKTAPVGRENTAADLFQWAMDYRTEYEQDRLGYMTIDRQYFMPVNRNIPVFFDRPLSPGDTWSAEGLEVHDFRDSFGIAEPYRIPFTANYIYLGDRLYKGKPYPAFSVSYRIFLEPDPVPGRVFPLRIHAASDQIVYWDANRGNAIGYEGYFRTVLDLSNGETWEYRGRAEAEVVEAEPMDRGEMVRNITQEIAGLSDVSVRVSDEGIVISLDNIQFSPDSAVLAQSELRKLDRVAELLMNYPDRDILVGGHTAPGGTAAGRLQLSLDRAGAVAQFLLSRNVRTPDRVMIRGYGSEQPIADNNTFEGMARNRRVEITILEN